ncbi:MAG: ferrochelatase [Alicyclobacillaceae bacterium]|nr:ferrochelatase [Alicyclobacillaceae bacterium]
MIPRRISATSAAAGGQAPRRLQPAPRAADSGAAPAHPVGVLVMAYGTPRSLDEVEAYYTHIRRGRPPSPEQLADLIRRYEAIGGVSPLREITMAQAQGLQDSLNRTGGPLYRVYVGFKHAAPFIEEAVEQMVADGVTEAVTLVLAPHFARMSVGSYQQAAEQAARRLGSPRLWHVNQWHLQPRFLQALANRVRQVWTAEPADAPAALVFTAHSLPARIVAEGDPYPTQLSETGLAVAQLAGISEPRFAWQSQGRTAETWLGPDILDVIRELAAEGVRRVVVCPAGFVSDHLEILYDLDIDAKRVAEDVGVTFLRTPSLNTDPEFLRALAETVEEARAAALAAGVFERPPAAADACRPVAEGVREEG